jgi:hypothetical protein
MIPIEILRKYCDFIRTPQFAKYEKDFARNIQIVLNLNYQSLKEPYLVKEIDNEINKIPDITNNGISISTKSVYIHTRSSSGVKFDYNGTKTTTELGDLIFIFTLAYNNQKYIEKISITQFKKAKQTLKWHLSKGDLEQLYLLSRFPEFTGVSGFFKGQTYKLNNFSKCLGSYGLMYSPGDFIFLSSLIVKSLVASKRNFDIKDIFPYINISPYVSFHSINIIHHKYDFCHHHCCHHFCYPLCEFCYKHFCVLGNIWYALNIYDFSYKYLTGSIGEPSVWEEKIVNKELFKLIKTIINYLKYKSAIITDNKKKENINNFLRHFLKFKYPDNNDINEDNKYDEDGDIGIISTIINLGEGPKNE